MSNEIYVFIDNSFLFIQGYNHVEDVTNLPANRKPYIDYIALKKKLDSHGTVRRVVLVGSNLPGSLITSCQLNGIEVFTLPKYPNMKTGKNQEKGVDNKLCWEIAKTIFTNTQSTVRKKIILCTGDKDFMSILSDIHTSSWEFELWLWKNAYSPLYERQVKIFGEIKVLDDEWKKIIKIGDKK
jgi:hypothetical protein